MGRSVAELKTMLGEERAKRVLGQRPAPAASPDPAGMNRTEAAYSRRLDRMRAAGEILSWRYEALTFRLGHRCNYTPDFLVISLIEVQIHEVKGGFVREDGLIKWKLAAERHPEFRFFLCRLVKQQWSIEEYKGGR
jgi:hypothetical protein